MDISLERLLQAKSQGMSLDQYSWPYLVKTPEWVEMGATHVEQFSWRECPADSAVPTMKLHSFGEL